MYKKTACRRTALHTMLSIGYMHGLKLTFEGVKEAKWYHVKYGSISTKHSSSLPCSSLTRFHGSCFELVHPHTALKYGVDDGWQDFMAWMCPRAVIGAQRAKGTLDFPNTPAPDLIKGTPKRGHSCTRSMFFTLTRTSRNRWQFCFIEVARYQIEKLTDWT